MKLYFIRHGQTEQNVKGIIQGHTHGKLSELGKKQADLAGKRLQNEKIDIIYSSDLDRASNTANAIHRYRPHTKIIFTKELRERDYGKLNGKNQKEVGWTRENKLTHRNYLNPPGGETFADMQKRAKKFFRKILCAHPKDSVLIVSHGTIGRAFLAAIRKTTIEKIFPFGFHNASISVFEITPERKKTPAHPPAANNSRRRTPSHTCKTIRLNDTAHLE